MDQHVGMIGFDVSEKIVGLLVFGYSDTLWRGPDDHQWKLYEDLLSLRDVLRGDGRKAFWSKSLLDLEFLHHRSTVDNARSPAANGPTAKSEVFVYL